MLGQKERVKLMIDKTEPNWFDVIETMNGYECLTIRMAMTTTVTKWASRELYGRHRWLVWHRPNRKR